MTFAFLISLLIFQVLLVFVHLATYATLAAAFGIGSLPLKVIFIALSVSFLVASLLTRWGTNRFIDWFYTFAAYWFGLIHFLFAGGVVFFIATSILYAVNIYVSPALLGGFAFGVFFLLHFYGTWNAGRVQVTNISVFLPNIPDAWKNKKILLVTDVHLGNIRRKGFAKKVAARIKSERPEMVLVGGDLFDGGSCDAVRLLAPLRDLGVPRGIYYVTGNHEYYLSDLPGALAAIRGVGMKILDNEHIMVDGLSLVGIDYHASHGKEAYEKIFSDMMLPRGASHILLRHIPDHLEVAEKEGIALNLSGHTHQGQIFPLSLLTKKIFKGFDYGLSRFNTMQVYTSSGAGTWGPPLRLGTKSEVVSIMINPA